MRKISKNKKMVMSEKNTIESILALAREQGVEEKIKNIIQQYQDILKGVTTEFQRKHIAAMGLAEIHKVIGCVGSLVVDGVEIIPETLGYENEINQQKKLVKLD